ncbi:MAG TPA: hypothetical protein PK189_03750, partial [bacterium]|nr:hypothetical protein [bacterium]
YIKKEEEKEQIPEITKIQAERIIIKQSELNLPEFINPFYENILIELLIKINPEGKVEKINFIKSSKIISLDKAVYNFVSKLIFNKDTEIAYKLLKINIKYD